MTINIKPETEQLVEEEIRGGHFATVDDIIVRGVMAWHEQHQQRATAHKRTAAEAIAHIRELRKGVTLNGLTIKDLVNEGRKPPMPAALR